jgi:hypothetical protein
MQNRKIKNLKTKQKINIYIDIHYVTCLNKKDSSITINALMEVLRHRRAGRAMNKGRRKCSNFPAIKVRNPNRRTNFPARGHRH